MLVTQCSAWLADARAFAARWRDGGRVPPARPGTGRHGFTMIELLVVISIIVILASLGMVQYRNSVIRAREAVLKEDLFRMRDAIDQYYADKTRYPPTLDALVSDGYLRRIPEDPMTRSTDTWQVVNAEPDPANPAAEVGVFDVKSGSTDQSLAGTPYSDW